MDNRPIGVFDSGVGGLTAVRAMLRDYPNESIVYFGDTARVPYGNREKDDITNLSLQDVRFLPPDSQVCRRQAGSEFFRPPYDIREYSAYAPSIR